MSGEVVMRNWVIYDHPLDHPDAMVIREWLIRSGVEPEPGVTYTAATLSDARRKVQQIAPGTVCLTRSPEDDPVIVEVWL